MGDTKTEIIETKEIKNVTDYTTETGFYAGDGTPYGLSAYRRHVVSCEAGDKFIATTVSNSGAVFAVFFNGEPSKTTRIGQTPETSGIVKHTDEEIVMPSGCKYVVFNEYREASTGFVLKKEVVTTETVVTSTDGIVKDIYDKITASGAKRNYARIANGTVQIKSKYNKEYDLVIEFKQAHGGNGLPEFNRVYLVANNGILNDDTTPARNIISSVGDMFSPHIIAAVNNIDGDNVESGYFTGGNHRTTNSDTGGATTARSASFRCMADGKELGENWTWCDVVELAWTNMIQGYNTSKAAGGGREIMQEDIALSVNGGRVEASARHTALEDIQRKRYYGLQMMTAGYEKMRYIGGSNRGWYSPSTGSNSGNKACRDVEYKTSSGDYARCGIYETDIGDFSNSLITYSALEESYKKSYFYVIYKTVAMNQGDIMDMRGYYEFKPY